MVSETLAQGRVVYRAGSMIVSTAATVVVLTGIISAPALLVGFTPGTPLEGPALPALELGWFPPGPSGTSVDAEPAAPPALSRPAGMASRSVPVPAASTIQPAPQPEPPAAAVPVPAAPAAGQPPVLAALPEAAEMVEEIIAAPTVAGAQPDPAGAVVEEGVPDPDAADARSDPSVDPAQPDEQDTVAGNEDHGETDLVADGADEQTDGTDQNPPWLDKDEPNGLLNLLLGTGSTRPLR